MDILEKTDFRIANDRGQELSVRRCCRGGEAPEQALVLLHGARASGIPSFDLDVPDGSLAEDFARRGFDVYIMDARGYGWSWRPSEMAAEKLANPPLARSDALVQDIGTVVDHLRAAGRSVAILGWATGAHWVGQFAANFSYKLSHAILYNGLYGATAEHPSLGRGTGLEDPAAPGRFNRGSFGAYWDSTVASLFPAWDNSIPIEDKAAWRSPEVTEAYGRIALESDRESGSRTPPAFRAPTGAMEDSFYLATGRQLWDASLITCPTLVIRATRDFWSRKSDAEKMVEHMVSAPRAELLEIEDGTHFVHLDRPERGRSKLIDGVEAFLKV